MSNLDRRSFLKSSLLTTASLGLLPSLAAAAGARPHVPAVARSRVFGANDDVRFAVVGFHDKGRGREHIKALTQVKSGARLVALCDVNREHLDQELARCQDPSQKVEGYTDLRKLLENKDIDVVSFATPNHWHVLGAIWAMQAGKDVYVETPVSHNVWEGRQMVAAAGKLGRIVQAGSESRSSYAIGDAIRWVREGHIGKILRARGLCYQRQPGIGMVDGPQLPPPSVDYDLWCGPAPREPLRRKNLDYDWNWVWSTGNGELGKQGIQQLDVARWVLGETTLSPRVLSVGGRLGYRDDGTTPNTLIVLHDYPTAPILFEVRGLPAAVDSQSMDRYRGVSIGVVVDCEGGSLVIPNYTSGRVRDTGARILDKAGRELKRFKGASSHFSNFIDAVRSRKTADLHAPILEGHLSSALCHAANISYRLGQPRSPEGIRQAIKSEQDLAGALDRMEEHLAANQVDLHRTPAILGAVLKMDPRSERFLEHPQANQLLTRDYRQPYVVPAMQE